MRAVVLGSSALAAACTLVILLAPAAAQDAGAADSAADQFDRATALVAEGEHAAAARALVELADRYPEAPRSADALFLAAELREERLDDPAGAAALYRRIEREHPHSRVALAAERRLESLERVLVDPKDAAPLARYYRIRRQLPEIGAEEALDRAAALLRENPDLPAATAIRLWMAGVAERAADLDRAAALYDQVLGSDLEPDDEFDTRLRAGTLAMRRGQFDRAESLLSGLPDAESAGRREARSEALAGLARARLRAALFVVAIAAVIVLPLLLVTSLVHAAGSLRGALRALLRPPIEALYLLPIAVVFFVFAVTGHHGVARAVISIIVVGVLVAWLSGAGLRVAPRSRWRPIAHAVLAGLTVIAACYIALHHDGLVDLIVSTVRFGPDV